MNMRFLKIKILYKTYYRMDHPPSLLTDTIQNVTKEVEKTVKEYEIKRGTVSQLRSTIYNNEQSLKTLHEHTWDSDLQPSFDGIKTAIESDKTKLRALEEKNDVGILKEYQKVYHDMLLMMRDTFIKLNSTLDSPIWLPNNNAISENPDESTKYTFIKNITDPFEHSLSDNITKLCGDKILSQDLRTISKDKGTLYANVGTQTEGIPSQYHHPC